MVHWIWILVAIFVSGSLGILIMAILTARRIQGLILWNREFRDQRDKARKKLQELVERLKVEQ